ncbi:hypothetical protein MTP99_002929 [Tenebrio molitor]|nr:hypothetical protein MTP99_002929 [Tenebrio molitor]
MSEDDNRTRPQDIDPQRTRDARTMGHQEPQDHEPPGTPGSRATRNARTTSHQERQDHEPPGSGTPRPRATRTRSRQDREPPGLPGPGPSITRQDYPDPARNVSQKF